MKEIKFRGKATEDFETSTDGVEKGEWVFGYYYYCRLRNSGIIVTTLGEESGGVGSGIVQVEIEVDHKTVGQFTGLKDKNGKEIYEGDLIRFETPYYDPSNGDVPWTFQEVRWNQLHCAIGLFENGVQTDDMLADWINDDGSIPEQWECKGLEIIGNIYDNPELLKD